MTLRSLPRELFAAPRDIGFPYHGLCVGGSVTLPSAATKTHPQPDGGGTIIVAGKTPPTITRTPGEQTYDAAAGRQWLDYAYLSGTTRLLGGQPVDQAGADWTDCSARHSGYWLYNDGQTTWLMQWEIENYRRTATYQDWHRLVLRVVKPFGLFGVAATWTPREIYRDDFVAGPEDYYDPDDPEIYLPFQSKTGAKLALNMLYSKAIGCDSSFDSFLTIYPWLSMTLTGDDRWLATIISGIAYNEITITGTGSRAGGSAGVGISASVTPQYVIQHDDNDDSYNEMNEHIRTVSPDGDFASWWMDEDLLKIRCGNIVGGAFVGEVHGESTAREAVFTTDDCYEYLGSTAPHIGVKLVDGWGLQAKEGTSDWAMLHIQAGPPGANGVSYDIANDEWSDTVDSCYV